MVYWVVGLTTIALTYLSTHPDKCAYYAVKAELKNRSYTVVLQFAYKLFSGVYMVIHGKSPNKLIDKLARFHANTETDALIKRITSLQEHKVTFEEFNTELIELKGSSKSFVGLGFQNESPQLDFRGSGKLGLVLFHNFCTEHKSLCQKLIVESRSDLGKGTWYPLALVSIRLTMDLSILLKKQQMLLLGLHQGDWLKNLKHLHNELLIQFHINWKKGVQNKLVKSYFDCEKIIGQLEKELAVSVLNEILRWESND